MRLEETVGYLEEECYEWTLCPLQEWLERFARSQRERGNRGASSIAITRATSCER